MDLANCVVDYYYVGGGGRRKHMRVALAKLYGKTEFRTTDKRRIDDATLVQWTSSRVDN